jgi:hypothetical protein
VGLRCQAASVREGGVYLLGWIISFCVRARAIGEERESCLETKNWCWERQTDTHGVTPPLKTGDRICTF